MSDDIRTGGFAFPIASDVLGHWEGMSLREYYAGVALKGLLAGQYSASSAHNLSELPREAFAIADAMVAEAERPANEVHERRLRAANGHALATPTLTDHAEADFRARWADRHAEA